MSSEPVVLEGRELDVAVARAMGCKIERVNPKVIRCTCPELRGHWFQHGEPRFAEIKPYSTELADAWEVVEWVHVNLDVDDWEAFV